MNGGGRGTCKRVKYKYIYFKPCPLWIFKIGYFKSCAHHIWLTKFKCELNGPTVCTLMPSGSASSFFSFGEMKDGLLVSLKLNIKRKSWILPEFVACNWMQLLKCDATLLLSFHLFTHWTSPPSCSCVCVGSSVSPALQIVLLFGARSTALQAEVIRSASVEDSYSYSYCLHTT